MRKREKYKTQQRSKEMIESNCGERDDGDVDYDFDGIPRKKHFHCMGKSNIPDKFVPPLPTLNGNLRRE